MQNIFYDYPHFIIQIEFSERERNDEFRILAYINNPSFTRVFRISRNSQILPNRPFTFVNVIEDSMNVVTVMLQIYVLFSYKSTVHRCIE